MFLFIVCCCTVDWVATFLFCRFSNAKVKNQALKKHLILVRKLTMHVRGWKKLSSKFWVYEFQVLSYFKLVTVYLVFLNITSCFSMVKSLFLHSWQQESATNFQFVNFEFRAHFSSPYNSVFPTGDFIFIVVIYSASHKRN